MFRPSFNAVLALVSVSCLISLYSKDLPALSRIEIPAPATRVSVRLESKPSLTILCTVPPHADNRWLTIAIPPFTTHAIELHGEDERIQFRLTVPKNVECSQDGEPFLDAVCIVEDKYRTAYSDTTRFICPNYRSRR